MEHSQNILSTKKLIVASLLSALSIVLTRYGSIMLTGGSIRLGFGSLPIILAGILIGPLGGALTGCVSDVLGILINSQGVYHPGFTLSAVLTGLIPGFMIYRGSKYTLTKNIIANMIIYLVISLLLNTMWLTQLLGKSFLVLLPPRALAQGIVCVITIFAIHLLMRYSKYMDI